MSVELTTILPGDTGQTGAAEKSPAVRDSKWIEAALTVLATSVMVAMISVLAVAMNLS
jgi:hypothetical protein